VSKRERDKGLLGEREIKHVFGQHGWAMRGLEGQGDHIAMKVTGFPRVKGSPLGTRSIALHVETKRQERLALPAWLRQAAEEAPPGTHPVVAFRQNRGQWYAALPLDVLLELIG
jgi:hypothetical protein